MLDQKVGEQWEDMLLVVVGVNQEHDQIKVRQYLLDVMVVAVEMVVNEGCDQIKEAKYNN